MNKSQQEIDLYIKYQHAISNLDQGKIEEGKDQLRFLLRYSILKEKDSRGVLYGIYLSLAEILGRSESVADKCEALRYYHESNKIIENCWQTFRKMSIIFRQLGLIPRALNLTLKALQTCDQQSLQPSLLYQACCLCFLMNEQEQFQKYNNLLSTDDLLKKSILELETYFNEYKVTSFVRNLLNEQALIQHKLSLIPHQQFDQDFFQQQYDCELKIDITDLNKFFRKIKRIFQSNLNIDYEKLIVNLKDTSIFAKTSITVTTKINQFSINPQVLLNGNKSAFTKYDKEQRNSPKQKEIQSIQPKFEQFVLQHYGPLLQSIKKHLRCEGIDFFTLTTFSEQAFGIKFDKEDTSFDKKENQIARFLIEKLNQTRHITILHLINQIIVLLYKEYQPRLKNQEKLQNEAQRKLIKCMIWAQFSIKEFTKDPMINIDILDTAIMELQQRLNFEKYQSTHQKIRIKNYQILIKKFKQQLMFETDIKQSITDPEMQQIYNKKYMKIMQLLHNDNSFLIDTQFELKNFQQKQVDLINKYRMQKQSKQSIETIIAYWKKTNKKLEVTEKTLFQVQLFKDLMAKEVQDLSKLYQIKQILSAVIKQLFFSLNQKEFNAAQTLFTPILDSYYNVLYHDGQVGLISLKIAFMNAYFQCDFGKPLCHFMRVCIPFTKYPLRQAFEIDILRMPFVNYNNLFQYLEINFIVNDFLELRMKMQKKNSDMMNHFNSYFEEDHELMLYLLQFIKEREGLFSDCVVQKKGQKVEIQSNSNGENKQLNEFSSESENELENPNIFFKKYRTVNLAADILENKFQIISNYYEYPQQKKEFLLNHQIQINMGNPQIRKQMRKFTKEIIKQEIGFSMKKLRQEFLLKFFNNFYFSSEFKRHLNDQEISFFASFMPFCLDYLVDVKKCQDFLNNKIKTQIMPKFNPTIIKYSDSLYQQFIQKQQQKQPTINLTEQQDLIKNQNLFCHIKANLCYLLYRVDEKKDIKLLCLALAHNETLFFWDRLYMELFELALNQLNQKQQSSEAQDWFISQKKVQVHLNKNPLMAHLFEYRFIMDLLKAQQRQIEYQSRPDAKSFLKVQQAYQFLLQQNQLQIPKDLFELQYNFRAMLLIEKKIIRKYRNISVDRMKQNIENFIRLTSLIKQMEQTQFKYYYNAYTCELEVIYDLYVNIYKFIKRFLRHKLHQQLNQFIGILLQIMPQLFTKHKQEQMQFVFPVDTKTYKMSHFTPQQIEEEEKKQYNVERLEAILNNLFSFFQVLASQLDLKKPQKYNIEALYYFLHIQYHNSRKEWILDQIYKHVCQIYKLDTNEIILFPKKLDNNCSENDEVLKSYFNHDLVYEYQKSKILKLIIKILFSQQKWQELMKLMEKLPNNHEIRVQQICIGLIEDYEKMEDPDLQKETLLKIHIQLNSNKFLQQYFKDNQKLIKMYVEYFDKEISNKQLQKDEDQMTKMNQTKQKLNTIWESEKQQNKSEMIIETEKVKK